MKHNKILLNSIFIVIIVTTIFFTFNSIFSNLDQNYFQEHQKELTTTETINMADGEVINYYYADTPYSKLANISLLLYLLIPILVIIVISSKYFLKDKKDLTNLFLSFIIFTFILQAKNIYNAVGWERGFGIILISLYGLVTFILIIVTNLILLKFRK